MSLEAKILRILSAGTLVAGMGLGLTGTALARTEAQKYQNAAPIVQLVDWDRSSLEARGCEGDCYEIKAEVCNTGDGDMEGTTPYDWFYKVDGNPKDGVIVDTGMLEALAAGECTWVSHVPELPGNYKLRVSQRPGHPGEGYTWSDTCSVAACPTPTCPVPTDTATSTATFTWTPTYTLVPPTPTDTEVPPTPTDTAVPPTPTDTPEDTPTGTYIPPTATKTLVPPTATNTAVPPTATYTVIPPTATKTNTPVPVSTTTSQPPSGGAEYFAINMGMPNADLYSALQNAGIVLMTVGAAGFGVSYLLHKKE